MIYKNLYFDYSAFVILALLILSTILRRMLKGKANIYFFGLIVIAFLTTVFDIWAVMLDNMHSINLDLKYFAHMGYLVMHSITMPFYVLYLAVLTDTVHIIRKKRILYLCSIVPLAVSIMSIIANIWTDGIFYFDSNDDYTRGKYMFILYVCAGIYMVYGLIYLIYFRKQLSKRHIVSLLCVYPAIISTIIVQLIKPYCLLEMFGLAVSLLFISLMVHRPEDTLDVVTGLYKLTAYMHDIKRSIINNKDIRIIMINVTNYPTIRGLLGYNKNLIIMRKIATKLDSLNKNYRLKAELYNLERGKFRVVVDKKHFDKVEEVAALINDIMKQKFIINHMSFNLVTQICIIDCPKDIHDVDALMAFGDLLSTVPYTGNVRKASELLTSMHYGIMQDMNSIIEEAFSNDGFAVYYQPIYSVQDKRFSSAEALLRLKNEKYGFISPEIFIPAAERSGMIHRIGDFVLEEVCKFIASDDFKSLNLDYIEVNLSVLQCMQSNLVEHIINILEKHGVRPEQINLEITETAASVSQQALNDNINALTDAGIKFSLDDFGTGYSNMQRVASLPLDIVKLDKSFTALKDNPKLGIVLRNTINMIKDMDMKIVVEGIETKEMVDNFSDMKCEYIQGFYFSKPVPRDEFVKFIRENAG